MNESWRQYFDERLARVLEHLPGEVHRLIDSITLLVDDHPSAEVMRQMGIVYRDELCGLYTGIPTTERSVTDSAVLSEVVHLYREGIVAMATEDDGTLSDAGLEEQIRITLLHELGHHHGLDEERLQQLGYD